MTKVKKRIDTPDQLSIFDLISGLQDNQNQKPQDGTLNISIELRDVVSECIRKSSLSRWEIAGKMSALLNIEVTKYMLDSWTAETKNGHRFPAEHLPAFCEAVGSHKPLILISEKTGVFVLPGQEALRAEIQKIEEEIKDLQKARQKRLVFLEEVDNG